jgi:hypothetical protein
MRYHNLLQRIGLAAALLVTGTLGELLHPAPSEAVNAYVTRPTVTAQIDPCGGGKSVSIANITKAKPGVVTTNGAHGFATTDYAFIDCASGMTQVNGRVFKISSGGPTTTSFSLLNDDGTAFDTSSYVAYVTGGSASKPISSATVSNISKANPGVVTTSLVHNFANGDKIYLKGVGGMMQVNDKAFTITVLTTTTFSIGVDTSTYGTFTSVGTAYKILTAPVTLNLTDCTDTELTNLAQGFTSCFFLTNGAILQSAGTTPRYFKITDSANGTGKPIIKINDTSAGMDAFVFSNFQLRPVTSAGGELQSPYWGTALDNKPNIGTPGSTPPFYGETHTMRLTFNHTFDYAGNNQSVCTNYSDPTTCSALYQMSLRISGVFDGISARGSNFTASGDYVQLAGIGNFGPNGWREMLSPIPSGGSCSNPNSRSFPLDVKYCVLQRELAQTATTPSSYSDSPALVQDDLSVTPYPTYICNRPPSGTETSATSCKPQMVITLTSTLRGPDAFILSNSMEAAGGGCTMTNNKGGTLTPQGPPCFSNSKKNQIDTTRSFFSSQTTGDLTYFNSVGAEPTPACQGNQCTCSDPNTCSGTIVITADVTPAADAEFPFIGTGTGVDNFKIRTSGSGAIAPCPAEPFGSGCKAFTGLTAIYSDPWVFTADITSPTWPIPDSTHKYDVDSIACASALNVYVYNTDGTLNTSQSKIFSTWTVDSGSVKTKATVTRLGVGDTVTCNLHIHKNASN